MKIVFTGDLSASGIFFQKIKTGKQIFDAEIIDIFKQADFVHINLENPITDRDFRPDKKGAALRAPIELGEFLVRNRINICDLANNHTMDCGKEGIEDTIEILQREHISYYGIGNHQEYIIIDDGDIKIALLASSHKEGPMGNNSKPGPCYFSKREIKKIVEHVKINEKVDFIIYNFHGGTEFNIVPEPKRKVFFHDLVGYGVDIVIGHHAHVPQGYEESQNSLIFYGLGNLMFDLQYHKNRSFTNISFILEIDLRKNKKIQYKQRYYFIDLQRGSINHIKDMNDSLRGLTEKKDLNFKDKKQYRKAWTEEAFRIYLNVPLESDSSNDQYFPKIKNVQTKEYCPYFMFLFKIIKKLILDCIRPDKRPFLLGSVQKILRYGVSSES